MNLERILLIVVVAVAVLAAIPQVPVDASIWGLILVLAGLVAGVMNSNDDASERLLVYVIAVALPTIAGSLDSIPVVGPWVGAVLGSVATGLQGLAVGLFLMALKNRLMPAASSSSGSSLGQ